MARLRLFRFLIAGSLATLAAHPLLSWSRPVPVYYAVPHEFGPWVTIYEHCGGGQGSLRINFSPAGSTLVTGEVKYYRPPYGPPRINDDGEQDRLVINSLLNGSVITHGASCASVKARFKTSPLPSKVDISVQPGV